MKKRTKQIIEGAVIFISTLLAGFLITTLSFKLFDFLSQNQMRILFLADFIILIISVCAAIFYFENKGNKSRRKKELEDRHNKRIEERQSQIKDIEAIIANNNFAA